MALEGINLLILSALAGIYLLFLGFLGLFKELPILKKEHFTEKPGNRVDFFDFVKGIAIVAIIVIHTTEFMLF